MFFRILFAKLSQKLLKIGLYYYIYIIPLTYTIQTLYLLIKVLVPRINPFKH